MQKKRILMAFFCLMVCAFSVGLFRMARFGVDPFQSLMSGLNCVVPLDFGTMYVIASAILFLFMLIADRHYIGFVTFINMFLVGYIVDFSHTSLQKIFGNPSLPGRVIFLIAGIVLMCFGSAFYFEADMGVSVYDAISLIIANTWKIGQFKYVRIISDLICVISGCALFFLSGGKFSGIGSIAGIGTVITAFFMGPLIDFFEVHITRPMLQKE